MIVDKAHKKLLTKVVLKEPHPNQFRWEISLWTRRGAKYI